MMKWKFIFSLVGLIAVTEIFLSCKKEKQDSTVNKPPVANAGFNQTIILPVDSVELRGNGIDSDGYIVNYRWSKISGPSSYHIIQPNVAVTKVKNLTEGVYNFLLTVTDNNGLSASKDVRIVVLPPGPNQGLTLTMVSEAPENLGAAAVSAGNKILFIEPVYLVSGIFFKINIYDLSNGVWTTTSINEGREGFALATLGNKVYIAGGWYGNYDIGFYCSSRIDIYDAASNTWSIDNLIQPRYAITTITYGNKIYFAGGRTDPYGFSATSMIDIFDANGGWSTTSLSSARSSLAATAAGNKIYFGGGNNSGGFSSGVVDIYDPATGSWTSDALQLPRAAHSAITTGNKVFWAGGWVNSPPGSYTENVEIWDIQSGAKTTAVLNRPKVGFGAVSKDNKILFGPGLALPNDLDANKYIDLYDLSTNTWSVRANERYTTTFIQVNGIIYARASDSKTLWKVEL
jgi:hypothetical protein